MSLVSYKQMKHKKLLLFLTLFQCGVSFAQKKVSAYLPLQGQLRYDSLEYCYVSKIIDMDSLDAFSEFNLMQTYADKTQDKILTIFTDFMRVRYDGVGNRKNRKERYGSFKKIQDNLKKLRPSLLRDRLIAEIEYHLGGVLYKGNLMSKNTINHLLLADLLFRKIGYENILFADIKLSHIGLYYLEEVGDFDTALKYLKEAELYVNKDPIDKYRIEVYKTYANCLVAKKQYKEAIEYNKLAIAQVRLKRDSLKIGTINGNIGEIILKTSANPIEAEPYFQQELIFRLRYKPKGFDDLAKVYGNLCQIAGLKRNQEEMLSNFEKAIKTTQLHKDTLDRHQVLMSVYKNRMIADSLLGDYKSALKYERLHFLELLAFQSQDLKLSTSEATVKFEAEKNKLQAELANQQAQNSRFWIVIVSLLLIVALIVGYFLYYRQRSKKDELALQLVFEQKEAERLKELNTLKTNFFTNISHEFRTPLSLILSPIEDLKKKYPNEGVLEPMRRNAQRLLSLINQLLDLSKLDSRQMQVNIKKNDLANFIKVLASSFASLAESRKIEFTTSQNRTEAIAYYDADKIEKILINLLSNAFKFTSDGGKISLVVNYSDDFREVEICVKDDGIGISKAKIKHIFDRFFQGDGTQQRNYEGSGIGLALVKEMVELHKGTIDVESIESEGTTFTVQLAVDKNSWKNEFKNAVEETNHENLLDFMLAAQPQQTMIVEQYSTDDDKILLIVEDNPDLRKYIRSVFEHDYRIFEATDGQDGIEKALAIIPDIVISDLMMPHLDGLGFCKLLKSDEKTSHIPVVMLTAKANVESRIEGFELGADDYLTKPFNREELLVRVKNLVIQRELLRQKYDKQIVDLKPTEVILPSTEEKFIKKAKEIVEKHISESEFTIEQFAEEMNLTSVVLRRKIKGVTNQSATQFVRKYRLQKAANLLLNNADTVSNIAYQVGFESLSYFTKAFQEEFGKLPSDFSSSQKHEN